MPRRPTDPSPPENVAPEKFENLLERLESIVAEMENGELPLDKLLANYEEGMRLVKACGDRLTDAEQKVEILSRSVPAPVADAGLEASASASVEDTALQGEDGAEDIRLF
jgi:exodeoxyribonuclease VII small subunit